MTMTTGLLIGAIAPSEIHHECVRKARSLAVKDPVWREPGFTHEEMNALLISAILAQKTPAHRIATKDIIEGLNAT